MVVKDRVDETGKKKSQIFLIPMPVENYKENASLFFLMFFKSWDFRRWHRLELGPVAVTHVVAENLKRGFSKMTM